MWATWTPTAAGSAGCVVHLDSRVWTGWPVDDHAFQWSCDVMTHELGHFLGHADIGQADPRSISYPIIDPQSPNYNSVPQCRHQGLWYGHERITRSAAPGLFGSGQARTPGATARSNARGARGRRPVSQLMARHRARHLAVRKSGDGQL